MYAQRHIVLALVFKFFTLPILRNYLKNLFVQCTVNKEKWTQTFGRKDI